MYLFGSTYHHSSIDASEKADTKDLLECATQVKARLVKYGRAEGVEKTLEMTGNPGFQPSPAQILVTSSPLQVAGSSAAYL